MVFETVENATPDVMYQLKILADNDTHPNKVDLGVGVYRNEQGKFHELKVLTEAKRDLAEQNPDHDYMVTTGNPSFLKNASRLVFGKESRLLESGRIASAQTISGTGSLHIAAMLLSHSVPGVSKHVYIGTPTWGNYKPLFELAGCEVKTYTHYKSGTVAWDLVVDAVRSAREGSAFVLQACGHNPTGADFTQDQWRALAKEMKDRKLFPIFDIAYHGLANGLEADIFCVRHFAELGFDLLVAQTFAKNFGLYGERVGALHVLCSDAKTASAVHDQVRFLIRSEFSSSPAYGARIVDLILSDPSRERAWRTEVEAIHERLRTLRQMLYEKLTVTYKTPGDWSMLTTGSGLFSLLPLNSAQCDALRLKYHIYLVPSNARITISGLNKENMDYVARAIHSVVKNTQSSRI